MSHSWGCAMVTYLVRAPRFSFFAVFLFFFFSHIFFPRWLCTSHDFIFRLLLKITVCSVACACEQRIFCEGMFLKEEFPFFFLFLFKNSNSKIQFRVHCCCCCCAWNVECVAFLLAMTSNRILWVLK